MFQSTPQGRFLTVNPALTRMLGYASSEELIAAVTNIHEQLYLNSQQQIKYAKQLEQFGVVRGLECQLYRKDKSSNLGLVLYACNLRPKRPTHAI